MGANEAGILLVDDEPMVLASLEILLQERWPVYTALSAAEARTVLAEQQIALIIADAKMPSETGVQLFEWCVARYPNAVRILLTGYTDLTTVVRAINDGKVWHYIAKPWNNSDVMTLIEGALNHRATHLKLHDEVAELRARCAAMPVAPGLVGTSPAMEQLRSLIRRVALSDRPVLVVGPTGSGKELVVSAIHASGARPDSPFLDLNCAAFPELLIESQLFGHEKGAFTGADRSHAGAFTAVGEGTLFLDEIAELAAPLQAKLLRVLETRRFRPVGSNQELRFQGRVVAATHTALEKRVGTGEFREDLFYRLNVLTVQVPGLADRPEDIPGLVAHFSKQQPRPLQFTSEALAFMATLPWPGNVRELRNLIDRIAVFADTEVVTPELVQKFSAEDAVSSDEVFRRAARSVLQADVPNKLEAMERALIAEALVAENNNQSAAARLLGVHRKVVGRRMPASGAAKELEDEA